MASHSNQVDLLASLLEKLFMLPLKRVAVIYMCFTVWLYVGCKVVLKNTIYLHTRL